LAPGLAAAGAAADAGNAFWMLVLASEHRMTSP
jgi:hypothetical protein